MLLDVEPDRLTVSAALRLPQAPLRQQFALIAPHLAGLAYSDGLHRAVADYLAGMTDRFAFEEHQRLVGG